MEKNNNITLNKVILYIGFLFVFILTVYDSIKQYHINNYGTYTYGVISQIAKNGSKSSFVYQFRLEDKLYEGSNIVYVTDRYNHIEGDSCLIKYYKKNPNWSRLIKNKEELKRYYDSKIIIEE